MTPRKPWEIVQDSRGLLVHTVLVAEGVTDGMGVNDERLMTIEATVVRQHLKIGTAGSSLATTVTIVVLDPAQLLPVESIKLVAGLHTVSIAGSQFKMQSGAVDLAVRKRVT